MIDIEYRSGGMNVQELFRKADPERVFYGYTLIRPVFEDLDAISKEEQTLGYVKLKGYIAEACEQIQTCNLETSEEDASTIFVMKRSSLTYGESYMGELESRVIKDREAFDVLDKNFRIWDDQGDVKLSFYSVDFTSIKKLAGYTIADESVSHVGINICCAAILRPLFFWGFTEAKRRERYKELIESLKEIEERSDEKNYKEKKDGEQSFDEFMEELERRYPVDWSDDEKEHIRLEKEFKNSVKDIEKRHIEKIVKEDHEAFIAAVKCEYKKRQRSEARSKP